MTGEELKILFKQDKAYLTTNQPMTLQQLGLDKTVESFKPFAYWTIRVIDYNEIEKKIFCEISSYQIGKTEFDNNQKQLANKLNDIQIISFRNINTTGFLRTLAKTPGSRTLQGHLETERIISDPIKQTINETFFVALKNVHFKLGGVSFEKKFSDYEKTIELTIPNHDIIEEFDAVKNYFANILKTKKIKVTAIIKLTDNQITSTDIKSPEINKIDKQLINNIKVDVVKSLIRKRISVEVDKGVFTMDEYFDSISDKKFKSNTFYKNETEFFQDLLTISNTKHYRQLRFLSSKHSHDIMKLRFIHKPLSFIFLIQGKQNYHIVWETLDTEEATYIWHFTKDINVLKMALQKIEDIIRMIKVHGKTAYINSADGDFKRLHHDYSNLANGFVKWKGELEIILA